jgi:hypothetical protein
MADDLFDKLAAGQQPATTPASVPAQTAANPPVAPATNPPAAAPAKGDMFDQLAAGVHPSQVQQVSKASSSAADQEGDFSDVNLAKHPIVAKLHKGFETGFEQGLGLQAPDPNDPHSLGVTETVSQLWNGLKRGAIHSFERLGGHQEDLEMPKDEGLFTGPSRTMTLRSGLALIGTPVDMIASGIESMADTLESGSKEMYQSARKGDHEGTARGAGKVLASLGQIFMGAEGTAANDVVGKVGASLEKGATVPGNSLLRATNPKSFLYGKNPGRVIIDEPIKPTTSIENLRNQISNAGDALDQQVRDGLTDPVVAAKKLRPDVVVDQTISDALNNLANEKGLRNRQGVIDAINTLRNDVMFKHDSTGTVTGSIRNMDLSPLEVSELKKSIGKSAKWDVKPGSVDPEIAGYVNDVRKQLYGKLNDMVDQAAPGTRKLNARYANVIEAERLLRERLAREEGNELGLRRLLSRGEFWTGMTSLLTGMGLMHSGVGGEAGLGATVAGAGMLADRAMRSTPGRIIRAQKGAAAGAALKDAASSGTPGAIVSGAVATEADQWEKVKMGDGSIREVHPADLQELLKRDPNAQQIQDE